MQLVRGGEAAAQRRVVELLLSAIQVRRNRVVLPSKRAPSSGQNATRCRDDNENRTA
jgi:hypothetical protein